MEHRRSDESIKDRREREKMLSDLADLKATVEYMAVCDHPEVFDDDEEVSEDE
jgi:hypothetical protein